MDLLRSGCGKSTWAKNHRKGNENNSVIVSRDAVRFMFVGDGDREDYFSKEDAVYDTFIDMINTAMRYHYDVYADATHLTVKARRILLNRLNLNETIQVIAVDCGKPVEVCIEQNAKRDGWANVPNRVINEMCARYKVPTTNEEYIDKVIKVGE